MCNQGGENGYRDRAEISTDMLEHPRLPPWHNAFILFSKEGCTEVKVTGRLSGACPETI
eukprot:CAMPEP_0185522060 /NCGR_PEP_ID=MMETSP1366-20130426/81741_1 /TAXON_ID=38817 /ORGANISM="Gephyrocapsa oceanica, Strain RCC1303" /LENGTH=58 /DNA_ID=CAMNT_0028133273 /DNA_START=1 /DNA_END=174 /DNA_ORIENTATION=+